MRDGNFLVATFEDGEYAVFYIVGHVKKSATAVPLDRLRENGVGNRESGKMGESTI